MKDLIFIEKKEDITAYIRENTWSTNMFPHGWGNGYVALPKEHPLHGIDYNFLPVTATGGITYSEFLGRRNGQRR